MSLKVDLKSQEPNRKGWFDLGWALALAAVAIAFFIFYFFNLKLQSSIDIRQKELQDWKTKVAAYSGIDSKLTSIKSEISGFQDQINHIWGLRYDPLRYSILLVRISKVLPENLWLTTLTVDPAKMQVNIGGSALAFPGRPPLAAVAKLMMNLQDDKDQSFSNVVLQSTTSSGDIGNIWTFTMTFNYNIPLSVSSAAAPGRTLR